jgi:hypothetical protein
MPSFTHGVRRLLHAAALAAGCSLLLAAPISARAQTGLGTATETRSVAGFDTVVLAVPADVSIEQGTRESLTLEAEPAVLRRMTSEVSNRRLLIGVAPEGISTRQPIRIRLEVRELRAVESRAPGSIRIGALRSDTLLLVLAGGGRLSVTRLDDALSLEVRITGAGNVAIGGGRVKAQQLAVSGAGTYSAPRLSSEHADVAIQGHGEVQLAASRTLAVRVAGVGSVRYHGDPDITRSVSGIASIEKD